MIINPPEIRVKDGEVTVSSEIELQTSRKIASRKLWYKFPEMYQEFLTDRVDGFVVALFVLAMLLGENVEVRGKLSPRLLDGIYEYQRVLHFWLPGRFKLVDITCEHYAPFDFQPAHRGVASSFSGGLDSFYTLWCHLAQNERISQFQVSHTLFVHGFDIPLQDEETYRVAFQSYQAMMQRLGIQLIAARTNAREFDGGAWEYCHGAMLTSLPLVLGKGLTRYYIPSSHTYNDAYPWGSDHRIDHLLSAETLQVVHDGATASRFEKTAAIAQWPEAYSRLRVCWQKPDGLKNCCRCNKCIRTMTSLAILDKLEQFETFPLKLEHQHIRNCPFKKENERSFMQQVLEAAELNDKQDLASDIRYALWRGKLDPWLSKLKPSSGKLRRGLAKGKRLVTSNLDSVKNW